VRRGEAEPGRWASLTQVKVAFMLPGGKEGAAADLPAVPRVDDVVHLTQGSFRVTSVVWFADAVQREADVLLYLKGA
jgi:hypothetical protein